MKALIETRNTRPERVFLIGVELKDRSGWQTRDSLDELAQLTASAGGEVVGTGTQRLDAPNASTFIGSGKAGEFARQCRALQADTVIFDDELSPAQTRNLEKIFNCKVLDRTDLILDIFARRVLHLPGRSASLLLPDRAGGQAPVHPRIQELAVGRIRIGSRFVGRAIGPARRVSDTSSLRRRRCRPGSLRVVPCIASLVEGELCELSAPRGFTPPDSEATSVL